MKRVILLLSMTVLVAAGWMMGVTTQPPEIKAVTIEVPAAPIILEKVRIEKIEIPTPVFIDRIRYIERDIGTAVRIYDRIYNDLEDWQSADELQDFLAADDTNSNVILRSQPGGVIKFSGQCEDYAIQLRARAADIGKNLEVIAIDSTEFNKWRAYFGDITIAPGVYHALNMAIIGNEIWYVEPQKDVSWQALYLD